MEKNYIFNKKLGGLGDCILRYIGCLMLSDKYNLEYVEHEKYEDMFRFIKGLDSTGGDLKYLNTDKINLMKETIDIHDSNGFNTLGYIKYKIDLTKLISNSYINKNNGHGLYVKNFKSIDSNNFIEYLSEDKKKVNGNLYANDFFNCKNIYLNNRSKIIELINLNKHKHKIITEFSKEYKIYELIDLVDLSGKKYDIVIEISLSNVTNEIIDEYVKVLDLIGYTNLVNKSICLLVNKIDDEQELQKISIILEWFKKQGLNINLESNDEIINFQIMKQSNILISSQSNLSWCAYYLSDSVKEYHNIDSNKLNFKVVMTTISEYNKKRLESINNVKKFVEDIGLEFELFEGVNGKNIEISDTDNENIKKISYQQESFTHDINVRSTQSLVNGILYIERTKTKKTEFGCAWSHINIYKKLLDDNQYDNYFVLEDDAEIICDKNKLIDMLKNVPENYDLCHIALSDWYPFIKDKQVNSEFFSVLKSYFNRTTGYLVSKKGAYKLLNMYPNQINVPSDDLINKTYRLSEFNLYAPKKYVVKEIDNNISIINTLCVDK
jgi:GR25 family glycosyltransferase involved in LPS biosynthesis